LNIIVVDEDPLRQIAFRKEVGVAGAVDLRMYYSIKEIHQLIYFPDLILVNISSDAENRLNLLLYSILEEIPKIPVVV